ncbi:PopZ family protein [Rhodopseudomonas sp. B29]|uniref:PopZ family protein n=1 Tax=Rhodopseudomonas sp. B29 TaxID=95607 RepID=UPI0004CE197E|nr:DUF2497 domain-containing protein [Rhodopseudomonas sp. B29]
MTQPAKAQEPSMEEILASIRRIIADDEAKPAAAAKDIPAAVAAKPEPPKPAPPSKPVAMTPPPAAPTPAPAAAKPAAPPPKPAPAPPPKPAAAAPAASDAGNSQDDIDALLAGLDSSTTEEEIRPAPKPAPAPTPAPAAVAAAAPEPEPDVDVLELTDEMALPEQPAAPTPLPHPPFHKTPLMNDLEFAEAAPSRSRAPEPAAPPTWSTEPLQAPMLSQSTAAAVESAFNSLATTVLSNNARTLEDLVKEMLRPMLKSWLDDNLPTLVERIVRQEIERVSRGR